MDTRKPEETTGKAEEMATPTSENRNQPENSKTDKVFESHWTKSQTERRQALYAQIEHAVLLIIGAYVLGNDPVRKIYLEGLNLINKGIAHGINRPITSAIERGNVDMLCDILIRTESMESINPTEIARHMNVLHACLVDDADGEASEQLFLKKSENSVKEAIA